MICYKGYSKNIFSIQVAKVKLNDAIDFSVETIKVYSLVQLFDSDLRRNMTLFVPMKDCELTENISVFKFLDNDFLLKNDDIVTVSPDGCLNIIYRKDSFSNSIFLTNRCNSRCKMCPQPPQSEYDKALIDIARKSVRMMNQSTEVIGITGGEPTIEWDGLISIIKDCRNYLDNTDIQLLTNGRILKDYDKSLELSNAGEDRLFFGIPLYSDIDSIHDDIVGAKGAFRETISGLYNLARAESYVELRVLITAQNYKRLPQISEYIYWYLPFVGHVSFMAIEPIGFALDNIKDVWIDPYDYKDILHEAVKILHQRSIKTMIFNHQLCILPKTLWGVAKKSISEWKNVYFEECEHCSRLEECGGFFQSANTFKSKNIRAIL
ncbi:His-Xaa-Ser system radical SAM maturase HxsC [Desulfoluna spongiiphila]|uniref:His-Xaa-Ser system radical SAM maturase HxsC n=1 Tax=Desulfoluna spongiiphila TaxID=419481 RepID=UPI0012556D56|nr:His-Xaa-Ser system radical SAM maturase HxsC [Desulfoluna spongiiphila]VVS91265.1 his-xaa-ser system radical sam maturase hxsc [Desulfoluna spongiiphila]